MWSPIAVEIDTECAISIISPVLSPESMLSVVMTTMIRVFTPSELVTYYNEQNCHRMSVLEHIGDFQYPLEMVVEITMVERILFTAPGQT